MTRAGAKCLRPFLSLREGTFRLGDRLVFQNTSWVFHQDEHWAVVGPNGGGKSLFADGVRGVLPLVKGELRYHFRAPGGGTAEEAIGHVSFEDRRLELHESVLQSRWNSLEAAGAERVREFLSYERVLEINPFEEARGDRASREAFKRRLRKAVELLELGPFLDRSLLSLSNGERQRVQLGRALCQPAKMLVLDEPFAGLDATTRRHFRGVLERLMRGAVRVLLMTTRPEDLPGAITHVAWVEDCQLRRAGPCKEVPTSAFRMGPQAPKRRLRGGGKATGGFASRAGGRAGAEELVRVEDVTVRYGEATILEKVNWTVRRNESWALLGPNGSGKTTLLSLLLGDNPQAYSNRVTVFGRRRGRGESIWELKRHIGSVSPELQLYFNSAATCFEVVASGFADTVGLFAPVTRRQAAAVKGWLERFALGEFRDTPFVTLSAGLQRMALLARALVKQPRLLVLDEPCQGLDAKHREMFIGTVEGLIRSRAVTVVYVTHRPDEIPPSTRRVLRLEKGRAKEKIIEH